MVSTGQAQWAERDLIKTEGLTEEWGTQNHYWVQVIDNIGIGEGDRTAFVLRRVDLQPIPTGDGKSQCDSLNGKRDVLEFAIPDDAATRLKSGLVPNVWMRRIRVECGKEVGYAPLDGPDFSKTDMQIVAVLSDETDPE